ncbi:OmpH family outer membrane protein [Opitutus terrae]|uniref:Outer membrane chaperone Skp (OmpH) n=1 Tax=Opitutus terrae (strain DSM 11246 / JCM 15787 / PB90-1) TaxID=452637 RepID=B1ZQK8_OPITP|nr:OmpH family outer membrane protein [Opitutus terrae]ACB75617.1 outer membrane chaperone Skp (OmpH) [Opitutus terrae PB90-1]
MKKTIRTLLGLAALSATAAFVQAQPALKILVVDMAKLYDGHYKTEEQNAKLRGDEQKAQEELDKLNKEGNGLVEKYKEMVDQSNNPAATAEAKSKAQGEAQKLLEQIQRKQQEVQSFQQNTRNSLQQRIQTFRSLMVEEISKTAVEIAKRKGATLLLDKSGPTLIGVSNILYSDSGYDITDEVSREVNKDRPATSAAPATAPAATPAAPAAAPKTDDSPRITVPGVSPKK